MITPAELNAAGITAEAAEIVLEWCEIVHAARVALDIVKAAARRIYRSTYRSSSERAAD